ncbi:filament-like plant protein 3 [Lotus japonicus]|uniref:filament-like plant protein 3 n=1 Tax=Lotus japonicus TaxID=34305 RepID=UPI00258FD29C|nr:filament-like plant protein 3 [Lotus japonicus]XP_057416647.1 filament-like plant protein 3 [Lotus japonicus]
MDRRSWLWRRKSSEKSPGETESSGSMSSLSERFSDDQTVYSAQATQSPEVTSKAALNEEEVTDVKILTDKLAAALLNISAKEDLVNQHSKVAEEAVSGWEKAENEVVSLKQQLDASRQKNSILEDRVSHLDGALKECMRQLRQARESLDQKFHEAAANNSHDWESKRSELEGKVAELEAQLQASKADASAASIRSDLHQKLEAVEKENLGLKLELQSRLEELEFRIVERDLSAQAAETASKQHLESVKKVAKLEAECRRLKATSRKTFSVNDHRSLTVSSAYVESFTDSMSDSREMDECEPSHSDSWELDQFKNEKASGKFHMAPSTEINLMDDFLEMERLASLPDSGSGSRFVGEGAASDQSNVGQDTMKAEVEAMVQKNAELEKKLENMEADKLEMEMIFSECQMQLETSENQIRAAELKVAELQTQLSLANKSNQELYEELKETKTNREMVESKLKLTQTDVEELISQIHSFEEEIQKERALSSENLIKRRMLEDDLEKERTLSAENSIKSRKLEDELSRMKHEAQVQQETNTLLKEGVDQDLKLKQEKEFALASSKFAECQKTIASLGKQLKSLATLEDFLLDSDKPMELTCEATLQGPQNGGEQLKSHNNSDLGLPKRVSEPPISQLKSRNGFGKLVPRSKSVSRGGTH